MNALLIGRCAKTAEQLNCFCDKVYVVLDDSFKNQRDIPELNGFPLLYSRTNISSVKGIPFRAKEIRKWVKTYQISIVFSNTKWDMIAAKLATLFLSKSIVLFATSHNSYSWHNKKRVKALAWLIRFTTDCFIPLASFVQKLLLENRCKDSQLLLLPNTINSKKWEQKCDYSFTPPFKMVYVAVLYPGKGQALLLDLAKKFEDKEVQIDCYGDFIDIGFVKQLEKIIINEKLTNKIRLLGRIDNAGLRSILGGYDAYICPSLMEMSPVNILEAMAVGLPVIASKTGGIPDIIQDGESGFLFEPNNVDQVVSHIMHLMNDSLLRQKIGQEGQRYVSEVYTPEVAGNLLREKAFSILRDNGNTN